MAFERMISFDRGGDRFCYRTAAVILDRGRVLLQGVEGEEAFWCLPGGRVEMGETAEECLRREMHEELGEEVHIGRLLWVVENFFEHEGRRWHEIGMYFLVSLVDESRLPDTDGPVYGVEAEAGIEFRLEWHDVAGLETLALYPTFLCGALRSLPAGPAHVVHWDPEGSPWVEGG